MKRIKDEWKGMKLAGTALVCEVERERNRLDFTVEKGDKDLCESFMWARSNWIRLTTESDATGPNAAPSAKANVATALESLIDTVLAGPNKTSTFQIQSVSEGVVDDMVISEELLGRSDDISEMMGCLKDISEDEEPQYSFWVKALGKRSRTAAKQGEGPGFVLTITGERSTSSEAKRPLKDCTIAVFRRTSGGSSNQ